MKALASYAKQSQDDSLEKYATRIKARATRRCGELLQETEPSKGGSKTHKGTRDAAGLSTRTSAATTAGLSERQGKTALRVAAVPKDEFERQGTKTRRISGALSVPRAARSSPAALRQP